MSGRNGITKMIIVSIAIPLMLIHLNCALKPPVICPQKCRCDAGVIDCSKKATSGIPQGLPLNTTTLRLQENELSELWHGVFPALPVVLEINLANNDIAYIGAYSFFAQPFLRKLNLAHNSIEYLLDNAFSGLRLIKLNLNSNPLRDLSENAFDNTTIEELSLNDCRLRTLPKRLLRDTVNHLRVLNLKNNHFPLQLPEGVFALIHFSNLVLKDNGMRNLRCLGNASVDKLELSGNPIGDGIWNGLRHATSLKEIYCNGCGIRTINITEYIPSIYTISLEDNAIQTIDDLSFAKVPNLRTLNLHNNRIRHLSDKFDHHLQKLSILDLSWNFLDDIKAESIDETSLTYLDLSENSLMTMPTYLRPILGEIRTVVLYGNPFRCNCLMLWFYRWTKSLTWRDTQIWGAECLYPKNGPLLEYRPDELTCKRPEIDLTKLDPKQNGENVTVMCVATGEPLPVMEVKLPSGETIVKYPNQNEAGGEIRITHTVTSLNCSGEYTVVCSVANFVSNVSKAMEVTPVLCHNHQVLNHTFEISGSSDENSKVNGSFHDNTGNNISTALDLNATNTKGDELAQGSNITWNPHNSSLIPSESLKNASIITINDLLDNTIENFNSSENLIMFAKRISVDFVIDFNETSLRSNVAELGNASHLVDPSGNMTLAGNDSDILNCCNYNSSGLIQNVTIYKENSTYNATNEHFFYQNSEGYNLTFMRQEFVNFTDVAGNETDWFWFASNPPGGSNVSYVIDLEHSATSWLRKTLVTILKGCIGFVVVVVTVTLITVIGKVIYHNNNSRMDYNLSKQRAEFVRNHLMNTIRIIRPISSTSVAGKHESRH